MKIEIFDTVGYFLSLCNDLESFQKAYIFLPFWKPSANSPGLELWQRVERLFKVLAQNQNLLILTNKGVVSKIPEEIRQVSRIVKDGFFLHSKIVLVSPNIVYCGSTNFTFDRVLTMINHMLRIESLELFLQFRSRFNLIWEKSSPPS